MSGVQGTGYSGGVFALATDGGPHDPSKWAEATTRQILDAPADHPLRAKVLEILHRYHTEVQNRERRLLEERGAARAEAPFATPETLKSVDAASEEIVGAVSAAGFGDYYGDDKRLAYLLRTLAKDFATSMNVERLWFRERLQKDAA